MKEIKIKKLRPDAEIPAYATSGAAACDLRACIDEDIVIEPGCRAKVPCGIAIAIPDSSAVAVLCARSGIASRNGVCLANGIGVIDSDYRGEIIAALINLGNESFTVKKGDRIAQLMFLPVTQVEFKLCTELDETERGEGGFGSTGTK